MYHKILQILSNVFSYRDEMFFLFLFFLLDTGAVFLFEVLRYMKWNKYCLFSKRFFTGILKEATLHNFIEAEGDTYKTP